MTKLIGLHGQKQCGKDTACQFILDWAEENNRAAERDAFADRLKLSFYRLFHPECTLKQAVTWADADKDNDDARLAAHWAAGFESLNSIPIRKALQRYGTEAHRDVFADDFWVDAVLPVSEDEDFGRPYGVDILVITDVRFPNEAERIKECGGQVWHITRNGQSTEDLHASEQPLDASLVDWRIFNDTTLEAYEKEIQSLCERFLR